MRLLFTLISLFTLTNLLGQQNKNCPPSVIKKSVRYLEKAKELKREPNNLTKIIETIHASLNEDSVNGQAWLFLGDIGWQYKQDKSLSNGYRHAIILCPDASPDAYYRLADYYFRTKNYDSAMTHYRNFLEFPKVKEENARDASQKIIKAQLMKNPVPFNPIPLKDVSGPDPEYLPSISPDQEICFFTRRFEMSKKGSLTSQSVEKFMISHKNGDFFDKGEPMPYPFNKSASGNEGGASVSIDNKHLYFTVNTDGNFDIYNSNEEKGKWSIPASLGSKVNDPKQWDSQPSISSDGNTLYFASLRDSVLQTSDIYITVKDASGIWGKASPLGKPVNTSGNEKTPFIHPDNKTLYFSSDQLPGMGGYDIFYCKRKDDGSWSDPVNIGYPINTEADELGFFVSTDGKHGYFASNNLSANGYDIYQFDMPASAKPNKVLFIKGDLKDDTGAPLNAKLELKNATTNQITRVDVDSITGKYASVVLFDEDYILTVKKKGFAYSSAYFSKEDSLLFTPQKIDFKMKENNIGKAYTLNNILFETSSYILNKQDQAIIKDFSDYLIDNPSLRVLIAGHTDDQGSLSDNMVLSENRAKAVYNFLIQCHIDASRLAFKGYGPTQPIASNESENGRAQNRRTEFVILAK